ncbi:MAG: hypothetical protein V4736_05115 [Bdellovibrionota bacterium]
MKRVLMGIFFCLPFLFALNVQAQRPLREIVTYEEFESLSKDTAARIPDIQNLWQWNEVTGGNASISGGLLRGILHWLYLELQHSTPQEIRSRPVPPSTKFLLQFKSDRDLVIEDEKIRQLTEDLPEFKKWDLQKRSVNHASFEMGGLTLEKSTLNPKQLSDPSNGIKDYYNGNLVFAKPNASEFKTSPFRNNSRTLLALRYLRMIANLPELTPTEESWNRIRQIAHLEMGTLKPKTFRLERALMNLYEATGDVESTMELLSKANLQKLLSAHGYLAQAPSVNSSRSIQDIVLRIVEGNQSWNDRYILRQWLETPEAINNSEMLIPLFKTNPDERPHLVADLTDALGKPQWARAKISSNLLSWLLKSDSEWVYGETLRGLLIEPAWARHFTFQNFLKGNSNPKLKAKLFGVYLNSNFELSEMTSIKSCRKIFN